MVMLPDKPLPFDVTQFPTYEVHLYLVLSQSEPPGMTPGHIPADGRLKSLRQSKRLINENYYYYCSGGLL